MILLYRLPVVTDATVGGSMFCTLTYEVQILQCLAFCRSLNHVVTVSCFHLSSHLLMPMIQNISLTKLTRYIQNNSCSVVGL